MSDFEHNTSRAIRRKVNDLNLGFFSELYEMTTAQVESMYYDLKTAQDAGDLNLETNAGVDNLERIVNKYS